MKAKRGRAFICIAIAIMLIGELKLAHAAYVIKLKNGNEYVTGRYWNKSGQIFFDAYGGVFGVDKAFVSKIEFSSRSLPLPISLSVHEKPASVDQGASGTLLGKETNPEKTAGKDSKSAQAPATQMNRLKKDENVLKEYEELQKRFGHLNDLPKYEVQALETDITSFREKLRNSDLAEAHKDEIEATKTLQRAIASYLKAAYP
jgi:hypothetical protein